MLAAILLKCAFINGSGTIDIMSPHTHVGGHDDLIFTFTARDLTGQKLCHIAKHILIL